MKIEFYRPCPDATAQTWLIVLGNNVYEMSANAREANGVNQYSGERTDFSKFPAHLLVSGYENVPVQIAQAAIDRARF